MLFNSFQFMVFFPVVTVLFFLLPHRFRWFMLLAASCYFYMAFIPYYILILFATIIVNYWAGILIERTDGDNRKIYLIICLVTTIAILFVFKYFNFFNTNFAQAAQFLGWNYSIENLRLMLPIGLSFHTFQSMSYIIEVYRGNQKAEKNFGIFSLYVMFYPQLVAGPVERPQNLLHQFYERHDFDYQRVADGLKLMAWGMFKKIVIADRLTVLVDRVYNNPYDFTGLPLIIASIAFTFQIYCDFSGYSDIAIGSAQVMGFKLMDNFNRPYFSKSVSEFWKRWHISLSTWFRDYLYISLGGNRVKKWRWYFNLFFTFLVSGLWHGANWTYIFWGAIHGSFLIVSIWTQGIRNRIVNFMGLKKHPKIYRFIQVIIVFTLVSFAWIFFRARNITEAFYVVSHLFVGLDRITGIVGLKMAIDSIGISKYELYVALIAILAMETIHFIQRHGSIRHMLNRKPLLLRWAVYYLLIISIIFFGVYGGTSNQKFIYFQF